MCSDWQWDLCQENSLLHFLGMQQNLYISSTFLLEDVKLPQHARKKDTKKLQ